MKKNILKFGIALALVAMAQVACKKAEVNNSTIQDTQVSSLAALANVEISADEVIADEVSGEFSLENEGLNPNYWVETSDWELSEGPGGKVDLTKLKRKRIIDKSFIYCLRKLDLSDRQIAYIKKSIASYTDCKASAISRARAIYNTMLDPYKQKFERLRLAYKAGKITEDQFKRATYELRINFVAELKDSQLREKLQKALNNCYVKLLENIKAALTDAQWKQFVNCMR